MSPEKNENFQSDSLEEAKERVVKLTPVRYMRFEAPQEMQLAAEQYEKKFGVKFDSLTFLSESLLRELHRVESKSELPGNIEIASESDSTILADIEELSSVANSASTDASQRGHYFATLKAIYKKLKSNPEPSIQDEDILFVGIEREGRILAKSLGWLPSKGLHPHAKRIPFEGGLLVGLSEIPDLEAYFKAIIIDGAIASGATIISIIDKLRPLISSFSVYSVHATYEGLNAINRYCEKTGLNISITVGHATHGLNKKFYAVDSINTKMMVVGDLGDTISEFDGE
jgi:hypothetical protein